MLVLATLDANKDKFTAIFVNSDSRSLKTL